MNDSNKTNHNYAGDLLNQDIWRTCLLELLQEKIENKNNNHLLLDTLLSSLDRHTHLVGIDAADVIKIQYEIQELDILFHEFNEGSDGLNSNDILAGIPTCSPLYLHFESDEAEQEGYSMGTVLSLQTLNSALSAWLEEDPDRDVRFSFVFNSIKGNKVKMWSIIPQKAKTKRM